eukprot:9784273-Alexandrium_andersonii.AAC.1
MSASLVGSEMCIRDSLRLARPAWAAASMALSIAAPPVVPSGPWRRSLPGLRWLTGVSTACLLYTSDAADDM